MGSDGSPKTAIRGRCENGRSGERSIISLGAQSPRFEQLNCARILLRRIIAAQFIILTHESYSSCDSLRSSQPLSFLTDSPNLERLHIIENPPRFPIVYFSFGSDTVSPSEHRALKPVADLLHRHPTLSILVEGRVQPDAPNWIRSRLSEARAHSAAISIYQHLIEITQNTHPSPNLPSRLKFEGKGSEKLVNGNFNNVREFSEMELVMSEQLQNQERDEMSMEAYRMWSQGWRRIDITVLGI